MELLIAARRLSGVVCNLVQSAMKLHVQILVVLKELHFNSGFDRDECLFGFRRFGSTKNPGTELRRHLSNLFHRRLEQRGVLAPLSGCVSKRFVIHYEQSLCICNIGVEVITDTIVLCEAFSSLVVQHTKSDIAIGHLLDPPLHSKATKKRFAP